MLTVTALLKIKIFQREIPKLFSPHSYYSFLAKRFVDVPCDRPHKLTCWYFEISNLFFVMILFQLFLKVSSDNPHKNYQLGFQTSNQFKKKTTYHCGRWVNEKLSMSWKWLIVERSGVKL